MGIRLRITLLLVGLLLLVLGAAGFFQARITERLAVEEMTGRGVALLAALSVPCAVALANQEIERLDDYLAEFAHRDGQTPKPADAAAELPPPDLLSLAVLDNQGRVLAHTRESEFGAVLVDDFSRRALGAEQPLAERRADAQGDESLLVALPIRSGLRWGTLEARFSLGRLREKIARLRWSSLLISALAVLAALGGLSLGLGRLVVRPVGRLAQMAEQLRHGRFDHRLPEKGRDELSRLAVAFNQAAEQLGEYTQRLEEKVRQRAQEILEKNQKLEEANRLLNEQASRLEQLATTDGLTGLANKRHFSERVGGFEILRARRGRHPLSLLMLDVDHFKHFNDNHGHLAGDRLLERLASLLKANLRATDIAGRFGGEEFCVALLDTDLRPARRVAEKMRRVVEQTPFVGGESQPLGKVTVSIGVAELDPDNDRLEDLIERADRALYRAKQNGRNRVES